MFHVKRDALPKVDVSRETSDRLTLLVAAVVQWAGTLNLVSRGDLQRLRERHVDDCLQLLPLLPAGEGSLVDLGSGGGFPGLVLAIASGRRFHLIEADRRKAAFLRDTARRCDADVLVHATRIEATVLPAARLVTARALASLDQLLTWCAPLLRADGLCLFLKGRGAEAEIAAAEARWLMTLRRWQSRTDPHSCVLQIEGVHPRG